MQYSISIIATEQSFRYIERTDKKSGFPKLRHYVGFWQTGSHFIVIRNMKHEYFFGLTSDLEIFLNDFFLRIIKTSDHRSPWNLKLMHVIIAGVREAIRL